MQTHNWDIVPGNAVGKFNLGVDIQELKRSIDFNYTEHVDKDVIILKNEIIEFTTNLIRNEYKLVQIALMNNFPSKFLGKIGIGSKLSDFKDILEYYFDEEMLNNYHMYYFVSSKYPGISFITEKPWDENTQVVRITIENPN
ncbi:hypothetical protein [Ruminiclostridium cellobioparum]|uniref:Uncharacterized protein n=1 Tax=Ruminiclostridium cellobioparum subsp. termitidis CT1112 TaxID=1195236 RepID=S0FHA9_RUMCE|nr:hypothetical protein [Ruminiclostridium cellobioparum]EMS69231.1 hypothetical protein CTER_5199 [Ruminiclostridium cellobioparum subsp. termitidis CT1112]